MAKDKKSKKDKKDKKAKKKLLLAEKAAKKTSKKADKKAGKTSENQRSVRRAAPDSPYGEKMNCTVANQATDW